MATVLPTLQLGNSCTVSGNLGMVTERYHLILRVLEWFENSEVFGDLAHALARQADIRSVHAVLVLLLELASGHRLVSL